MKKLMKKLMNKKTDESVNFISSTYEQFTISIMVLVIFNVVFRGMAGDISEMSELFVLCGEGLSLKAITEMFLLAVIIARFKYFWFSGRFFKNMLMVWRIPLMLINVLALVVAFSLIFHWFPPDMWQSWLGLIVSFLGSTLIAFGFMTIKSNLDSKIYQDKLDKYKNSQDEEDTDDERD